MWRGLARQWAGTALAALALVAITAWMRAPGAPKAGSSDDPATTHRPLPVRKNGYVSSNACRSCHPQQHASWHRSYHRTMTQVATPQTMIPKWDGTLEFRGKQYHLERDGDCFWVDMVDPEWDRNRRAAGKLVRSSNTSRRVRTRVVQTTGSHHQQVFWTADAQGRDLRIFPFTWMVMEQRWIPYEHSFLRPVSADELSDVWNEVCIACHATGGRPRRDPQTLVMDTEVGELGIACEACHGPGEEHVEAHRDPLGRYRRHLNGDEPDPTIVNPARLDAAASAQVCGQCHSVFGFQGKQSKQRWWQHGFSYRPGGRMEPERFVYRRPDAAEMDEEQLGYADSVTWADGMIRVSGRDYQGLIDSPCFEGGEYSCLSCHSMHESEPMDQLAAGMEGDEACLKCHDELRDRIAEHTHHPKDSAGSRCYNCHMPYTTYGLFKAIRSHTVSNPTTRESLTVRRPNACNLCHIDRSLAWTGEHLTQWYGTPQDAVTDPEQRERSAALLWLLKGDAGQRAIAAQALGWAPAHEAAGSDWIAPFLAEVFDDPYRAVRFIAARSITHLPRFTDFKVDFLLPAGARDRVHAFLAGHAPVDPTPVRFLLNDGRLDADAIARVKAARDDRLVRISE